MKKLLVAILLCCFCGSFAQNKKLIDSLENLVKVSKKDTNVLTYLFQLNNNYRNFNPDSAFSKCYYALRLSDSLKFNRGTAKSYLCLAMLHRRKGEHALAIDDLLKALKLFESLNDKGSVAKVYGNMGITYWQQGNFQQSLKFYQKALVIDSAINNKKGISSGYNNIGGIYEQEKNYQKSLEYYLKAIKMEEELGDEEGLSDTYGNIGNSYFYLGNNDEAIKYHLKSIEYCKKIGNNNSLASGYINMGAAYAKKKNYKEALKNIEIGLKTAQEIDYKEAIKTAYKTFSDVYTQLEDYKMALTYFRQYSDIQNLLINEANNKQILEMETIYQSEKKDKENKLLQKENELSLKTIKHQKTTSYFIISGLVLSLLLAFFIFRGLKIQRKANGIISKQKQEVEHQKELIEEKQKEIIDSITYARRIQRALLTSERYMEKALNRLNGKN